MRWRRLFVIVFIFLVIVVVYLQSTVVLLNVKVAPNSQKAILNVTHLNNKGVRGNVFQLGGLAIIPRDTARIEATYDKWQTTADVTPLPWIGIKDISISVEPDKNAAKVAGGSLGCVTYDKVSSVLASYSCNNPSGLYTYITSDKEGVNWKNEAYLTFPQAYSVTNYKNGLMGISNSTSPQLFYADMSSKAVSLPAIPQDMNASELSGISVIGDQIKDSDHFLLVGARSGKVYFATNDDSETSYRQFTAKKEWLTGGAIQCVLRQVTAYCYVGGSSASSDSHEEDEAHEKRSDGKLIAINFGADKITYTLSTIPESEPIDKLYVDNNSQLYAKTDTKLYSLDMTRATTIRTIINPNVGDVSSGATLYYISNNKVYEFNNKTRQTTLRFTSDKLRLSTINQIDAKVFVNAYIQGVPGNILHTYELLQDQNITPGERIIDKLPVALDSDESPIVSMDFKGNNIHIVLPNYVAFDNAGNFIPDTKSFDIGRQQAINYLSTLITNIQEYRLTFSRVDS